jgi:hypothetical protein
VLETFSLVNTEHFGPAVAERADECFDFDHGFDGLLEVGFEETAHVIIVKAVEVGGMIAAGLMIEVGLELGENVLRFDEICINNLDTTRGVLGGLEGVVGVAHETEGTVVKHEDKVSRTGSEHRLGLISASVALGHGRRHDVSDGF